MPQGLLLLPRMSPACSAVVVVVAAGAAAAAVAVAGWLVGVVVVTFNIYDYYYCIYIYTSICTSHITSPSLQYFSQSQAVFLWTDSGSCSGCVYFMPSPRISCCRV
jgi:hypothetical protein